MVQHSYEEKTVASEVIYAGKMIRLEVTEVQLPNGKSSSREIIKHPGAVAVLAILENGNLILVDQYRKSVEQGLLEIPAGKMEKGEESIVTAARELEEETGFKAGKIEPLYHFYTAPGFTDEKMELFIARDLQRVENPSLGDEDEFIDLLEVSLKEALVMVQDGRIQDAKSIIAVQHYALHQLECGDCKPFLP